MEAEGRWFHMLSLNKREKMQRWEWKHVRNKRRRRKEDFEPQWGGEKQSSTFCMCACARLRVCVLWQNENRDKCRSNKPPVPQRLRVTEESVHACERVCVLGMYYTRMLCACIMSNNHPYIRRYLYLQRKLRINHTDTHLNTTIVWGDEWENVQTRW